MISLKLFIRQGVCNRHAGKVSKTSFLSYDRDNEASSEKQEDDSHVQSDNVWGSDCRRRQGHAHKSLAKHSSPKL